jgi:hypothetical protein
MPGKAWSCFLSLGMSALLLSMATRWSRVIRALDLVISVDTMPAHLASALGVPVWTLLDAAADWRWMDRHEQIAGATP